MIPTITDDQISIALRALLLAILPDGVECIAGQTNRVPEPTSPDFVMFQVVGDTRLSTNVDTYDGNAGTVSRMEPTQTSYQIDVHGPNSTNNARAIKALWRSEYATMTVDSTVFSPLYASDGHQMPFKNGEGQYENRWVLTLYLQINPALVTPMQFADNVVVTLVGA